MRNWQIIGLCWTLLTMLFCSGTALADSIGDTGELVSILEHAEGSDDFTAYKGAIVLRQISDGQDVEYRWGGAACPGKDLTDDQVSRLFDLASAPYMLLTPKHKPGAGSNICLVGFVAFNRKFL